MYLAFSRGLADAPAPTTLAMRPRAFRTLDRFGFDQSALTARLKSAVRDLSSAVVRSLGTAQPITLIRLKGHTDSTGKEAYNLGLGDRRAKAVELALRDALKAHAGSVRIVIESSPGKAEPRADNRSADGRAQNRRVEVFVTLAAVSTPPPGAGTNGKKVDLTITDLPPEPVIKTRPSPYFEDVPPGKTGKSLREKLEELLSGLPQWTRSGILDLAEKGACAGAAAAASTAGGSASLKDAIEQTCKAMLRQPGGVHGLGALGDPGVNGAIRNAKRRIDGHLAKYKKLMALGTPAAANAAAREKKEYVSWRGELAFLEGLKAVHETQRGVPLSYSSYPITKTDPTTGRSSKDTPWRFTNKRQAFDSSEARGSFCLGTSRGIAFRSLFGLDRPSNRAVLTELKTSIEAAKKAGDVALEAQGLISRVVSHRHDPGSLKQFNQDILSRYRIKNAMVRHATRAQALAALKKGAPVIASMQSEGHWVLVRRSPRGQIWWNDPLDSSPSPGRWDQLGVRFELIVDQTTGEPITHANADTYK